MVTTIDACNILEMMSEASVKMFLDGVLMHLWVGKQECTTTLICS